MKTSRFNVETTDIQSLATFVTSQMNISYSNETDDMIIIASEQYKFRTNSTQMNMIIVKKHEFGCCIDIIGAAGGTGLFNFSLWAESGFVKSATKLLENYCTKEDLKMTEEKTPTF